MRWCQRSSGSQRAGTVHGAGRAAHLSSTPVVLEGGALALLRHRHHYLQSSVGRGRHVDSALSFAPAPQVSQGNAHPSPPGKRRTGQRRA